MLTSKRRWVIAIMIALYLYFLLPATAELFFKLYHLTHIGPIYWGYSGFKAAGYYFGIWEYQLLACVAVAVAIVLIPALFKKRRKA